MDIAYYISDLLGQQGELSVPNLGYFVQIRMPAYYDDGAKKFFPPHFSVQFDPQIIDEDDSLAAYITGLKKISLASAKYFIEKYISNLKNQAAIEDVAFANLGTFSSDGIKLTFNPGIKTDAPAFFAFTPVEAYRIGEVIPVTARVIREELIAAPVAIPEPESIVTPEPEAVVEQEESFIYAPPAEAFTNPRPPAEYMEDDEPRRTISTWTVLLIILTAAAIAFVALYKFKPELVNDWLSLHKNPYTASQPIVPPAIKQLDSTGTGNTTDTVKTVAPTPDTVVTKAKKDTTKTAITVQLKTPPVKASTAAPVKTQVTAPVKTPPVTTPAAAMPDSIAKGSWVIYGGAFPIRSSADNAVSNYKSLGYTQARLLTTNVKRGNNYKVILGAYKTKAEATDAGKVMLMTHKINISVEQL